MSTQTQPKRDEPAVVLQALSKTFKPRSGAPITAVDNLDLTIMPGEVIAFLGPNGAGKTTTLDILLGLTNPTSGTAQVLGGTPRQAVTSGRVSAVLQTGGLIRDFTVEETVRFIAATFTDPVDPQEVIARAGLTSLVKQKVSKCSGGEQQRLRFALALLPDPDLLVLDEPTAGMDVSARREFWDTMQAEAGAGRTIVFATHYLQEAEDFAQRTVVIDHGAVVADGPTSELRQQVGGNTVSASVPGQRAQEVASSLRDLPHVAEVSASGNRLSVTSTDSDAVARSLLTEFGGYDLQITKASLESAFVNLTRTTTTHDEVTS